MKEGILIIYTRIGECMYMRSVDTSLSSMPINMAGFNHMYGDPNGSQRHDTGERASLAAGLPAY